MPRTALLLCIIGAVCWLGFGFVPSVPADLQRPARTRMTPLFGIDNDSAPPYIALITEPDACSTDEKMESTFAAVESATSTGKITLVSIRLTRIKYTPQEVYKRALELTRRLLELAKTSSTSDVETKDNIREIPRTPLFRVVCSSDWVDLAVEAQADGVHVKESHLTQIPTIRKDHPSLRWIGTSTHSVASARESWTKYQPDYYFVGTCFLTASHPEKSAADLEGPSLPGKVRQALQEECQKAGLSSGPVVFAIGGIDDTNCHIPVSEGADGVAVIRSILQAPDPAEMTNSMVRSMELVQQED